MTKNQGFKYAPPNPLLKVSKPAPGMEPSLIKTITLIGLAEEAKCGHVHISYMHSSSAPAVASVAERQLGDIEAGTGDTTARNKKHTGR